jgi:hypothetical protein
MGFPAISTPGAEGRYQSSISVGPIEHFIKQGRVCGFRSQPAHAATSFYLIVTLSNDGVEATLLPCDLATEWGLRIKVPSQRLTCARTKPF